MKNKIGYILEDIGYVLWRYDIEKNTSISIALDEDDRYDNKTLYATLQRTRNVLYDNKINPRNVIEKINETLEEINIIDRNDKEQGEILTSRLESVETILEECQDET